MIQMLDPQRAIMAAGIAVAVGLLIFLVRNKKTIINRLRGGHE